MLNMKIHISIQLRKNIKNDNENYFYQCNLVGDDFISESPGYIDPLTDINASAHYYDDEFQGDRFYHQHEFLMTSRIVPKRTLEIFQKLLNADHTKKLATIEEMQKIYNEADSIVSLNFIRGSLYGFFKKFSLPPEICNGREHLITLKEANSLALACKDIAEAAKQEENKEIKRVFKKSF